MKYLRQVGGRRVCYRVDRLSDVYVKTIAPRSTTRVVLLVGISVFSLLLATALTRADRVSLLNKYYSPERELTIYSYMLAVEDPSLPQAGQSQLELHGVAPLKNIHSIGDANYWKRHEVVRDGNGNIVRWFMTEQPPRPRSFYTTFDIAVHGNFEEGTVDWQHDGPGYSDSGTVIGPIPADEYTPEVGKIEGIVWFDADEDACIDDDELRLERITVALFTLEGWRTDPTSPYRTTLTDDSGYYAFGGLVPDTYLVLPWPADEQEAWQAQYVICTTDNIPTPRNPRPVQVITDSETLREDFGLALNLCKLKHDLKCPSHHGITGDNRSPGYWKHQIAATLGCQGGTPDVDVYYILGRVEGLWLYDPYQFTPLDNDAPDGPVNDDGLVEAYNILKHCNMREKVLKHLLAGEMNWVARFTSNLGRVEELLYWYAEWLLQPGNPNATQCRLELTKDVLDRMNDLGDC